MSTSLDIAARLAVELRDRPAGARVAGEHELMARFGVGRAAARAALQELERRLLVRRVRGAGTFVNRRIDYVLSRDRRPSWHETVAAAGGRPRSVVRDVQVLGLPAEPASRLGLAEGVPAHRLRRQSYVDDLLASFGTEWVPVAVVADLDSALHVEQSLDAILRQQGRLDGRRVRPVRSWSRVSLDVPSAEVFDDLALESSAPAWRVESVSRDADSGVPVMCSSAWMRADAVRVVVELGEP